MTQRARRATPAGHRKMQQYRAARRARLYAAVASLKDGPCADCGGRFPEECMDFDHIGEDKSADVSLLRSRLTSLATIQAEIAKCDLVCANCHRTRTKNRLTKEAV